MISFKSPLNQLLTRESEKERECKYRHFVSGDLPIFNDDPPKASRRFAISASPTNSRNFEQRAQISPRGQTDMEIEGRISVGTDHAKKFPLSKAPSASSASFKSLFFLRPTLCSCRFVESWKRST